MQQLRSKLIRSSVFLIRYDAFASSIKYSLGLASIMNKYNISSTNEMTDYKSTEVFIKTKKAKDQDQANTLIFVNKRERAAGIINMS
jgi:hypothetical protein